MAIADQPKRRRTEYVPPSDQVIDQFARDACELLAEKQNDPSFRDWEVHTGFADFLKVLARIEAKRLNAEQDKAKQQDASQEIGKTVD